LPSFLQAIFCHELTLNIFFIFLSISIFLQTPILITTISFVTFDKAFVFKILKYSNFVFKILKYSNFGFKIQKNILFLRLLL